MPRLKKLAFKKIEDFDRNKLTGRTHNCQWNNDPQYTHLWNDLDHLKSGKIARCGQPETRSCTHRVEYGIAGFRNTCPIAGRCGTYATPAPLRFSQFDFSSRNVKGKIELNTVQFSFKHKNNGVNVANGREAKTWGGQFSKVKVVLKRYDSKKNVILDSKTIEKGPSINKYKTVSVNFDLDKIVKHISSATQRKTFNNNRILDLTKKDNFAIELHYYRVENTNPSVIRLKDTNINVTFTYLDKPSINIGVDKGIINCSSKKVTHTVKVNSEEAFKNLTYKSIPVGFSKPSVTNDKSNYTKTFIWTYTKSLTDTKATITYTTKANAFKAEEKTTVKIYENKIGQIINDLTDPNIIEKPISTITKFVKGSKYNEKTVYVSFDKLQKTNPFCYDYIRLHIKNEDQNEFTFDYSGDNKIYQCQASTKQNVSGINRCFYEQVVNKLKCGEAKVTAEFYINKKSFKTVSLPSITVTSPPYSFTAQVTRKESGNDNATEDTVDDSKHIQQNSNDNGDPKYTYYITFTRSDDYQDYPSPTVENMYNETQNGNIIENVMDGNLSYDEDKIKFKINIDTLGTFKVGFYYHDLCKNNQYHVYHEFEVVAAHKQYYDDLYIQENDADYTYESIVIREGDNNRVPIAITSIQEINSYDKIDICFNGDKTNISEMGFGKLIIRNRNNFTVNNLAIELNPLVKDEETGEYDWINLWETIFTDFESNLFAYNIGLKGLVEVVNNGEDIFLVFPEILPYEEHTDENDNLIKQNQISINLPFSYKDECTYYMSLFINGLELTKNNDNKFMPRLTDLCSFDTIFTNDDKNYAKFIITDTMLLDLKINNYDEYINIDQLNYDDLYDINCNLKCSENDSGENECNICEPFTVLYSVTNIDSISPISGEEYFIRIGHSPELEHFVDFDGAYELRKDIDAIRYPLPHTHVQILITSKSLYEDEEPITYTLKTDENGEGIFYYTIAPTELQSYNTESLRMHQKFEILYNGNNQNNPCSSDEQNQKLIIVDEDKFNTEIIIDDDFSQYKPGETVPIHFQLIYIRKPYDNGLYINLNEEPFVDDFQNGRTVLIPVTYEGVKTDLNQVLETSIETISDTLTENYVSKKIYCNIDTQVKVDASLEKTLVQQNDSNTLNILVKNGLKPNQKVKIRICTNGYNIKNINYITNGTYSVYSSLLYWNISNMNSYEVDQISIDLQAQQKSGRQCIRIKAFDYLHEEEEYDE